MDHGLWEAVPGYQLVLLGARTEPHFIDSFIDNVRDLECKIEWIKSEENRFLHFLQVGRRDLRSALVKQLWLIRSCAG